MHRIIISSKVGRPVGHALFIILRFFICCCAPSPAIEGLREVHGVLSQFLRNEFPTNQIHALALVGALVRTTEVGRPVRMSVRALGLHSLQALGLLVAALSSTLLHIVLDGRNLEILGVLVDVEGLEFSDVPGPPSVAMVFVTRGCCR